MGPIAFRARLTAITLSKALEDSGRAPTEDEQAQLLCFIGFGATELAQNCFRRPGETEFRPDWQAISAALEAAVTPEEYVPTCNAPRSMPVTRRRRSSAHSGAPRNGWA